jgi:rod shape-determining protein MreB
MGLLDFLKDTIGIDPGSQHLRIVKDGELVFNESSQISFDKTTHAVTGLGNSTSLTDNDLIIKPVDCAIADFQGFEMLLREAMKKSLSSKSIIPKSYKMYYCIPTSATEIEKRAYRDSAEHAGAIELHMIYQSCCSAVGLNILFEQKDFLLVDFGHSKIEMTVFGNSLPISVGVIKMGTSKIYRLLKNFIKRKYKIIVTDKEIDFILTALKKSDNEIKIKDVSVKASEMQDLLDNFFTIVNDEFMETIERVSGHSDIEKAITAGIYFTGGGSTIDFLRDKVTADNRIKRTISQNPLLDNINGLKKIMADRAKFAKYIMV